MVDSSMIVSTLKGRLCNAMFQIATGYALANRLRVPFAVNFALSDRRVQQYKNTVFANVPDTTQVAPTYEEPSFSYSEIPLKDNQLLSGYFQSSKYFQDCKEQIKKLFILPDVSAPKETVGVHFRRGDYLRMSHVHPVPSNEWYNTAVQSTGLKNVIACTEPADVPYVEGLGYTVNQGSDLEDLVLLSKCDALVMSNSSYSWWAAFLGNHKKVIAPKAWFGPSGVKEYQDIYEKEWIQQ